MKHFFCLGILSLCLVRAVFAGDNNKEVLSLSNGKYVETFDQDSVEQIGNMIYNVNSRQIVALLTQTDDASENTLKPDVISRWLSIDPLAAKYPSISPYVFCGNNPILFVDPNGAELVLSGDKNDVGATVTRMQSAVGGSYTVSQNKGGSVIMTANADFKGDVSDQQKAAIKAFLPITSLETGKTKIGIVNNSDKVDVGSFDAKKIDIGDVAQYDKIDNISGAPTVFSGNGKLIHEMTEQFENQTNGADQMDAHNKGVDAENAYNGSQRDHSFMDNGTMVQPNYQYIQTPDHTTGTSRTGVRASNGQNVIIQESYQVTNPSGSGSGKTVRENLTGVTQMP